MVLDFWISGLNTAFLNFEGLLVLCALGVSVSGAMQYRISGGLDLGGILVGFAACIVCVWLFSLGFLI